MSTEVKRRRLEIEAIVLGYAMSRMDAGYLEYRGISTWKRAFEQAAQALTIRPASLKNLRDEFDPVHGNSRQGWHQRPLRPNRQRVLEDLKDVSDDALMALVDRILVRDEVATAEAIDSLVATPRTAHNVAERLLTGRRAEEHFVANSQTIAGVKTEDLIDCRNAACGFDFGVRLKPTVGIEVKGLKRKAGDVLFTDREWREAKNRLDTYWLVIVGNIESEPTCKFLTNPYKTLKPICSYQVAVAAVWRSRISVAD